MVQKNVLIVIGHPRSRSFCEALAHSYADWARASGHEVRLISLAHAWVSRDLIEGVNTGSAEEPILVTWRGDIVWMNHIVFVFPTWWYTVPACLKWWFDRLFVPKFSHQYTGYLRWKRLLQNRTGSIYTTCGGPRWIYWLLLWHPWIKRIRRTLRFVGITPKKSYFFSELAPGVRSDQERAAMLRTMYRFGQKLL